VTDDRGAAALAERLQDVLAALSEAGDLVVERGTGPEMRVYFGPEDIRAALKSLGPIGCRDESIVATAAEAAAHVLEGGTLVRAGRVGE
jgi:hypothetical protein